MSRPPFCDKGERRVVCGTISLMQKPLVLVLSLILPGTGHFFHGHRRKGLSLIFMVAVVLMTFFFSSSLLMKCVLGLVYLSVLMSSVVETYLYFEQSDSAGLSDSKIYITFMLLTTGFGALPLLWQSGFSKRAKVIWTLAVPALAVVFFTVLYAFKDVLEQFLAGIFGV